jgi:hypothetical protein
MEDDEAQPLDDKERILSLTRACTVNGFYTLLLPRGSYCALAGNIGGRALPTCATWRMCNSLDPQNSDLPIVVSSQGGHTWLTLATTS